MAQKWEYKVFCFGGWNAPAKVDVRVSSSLQKAWEKEVNDLGEEGWELVTTTTIKYPGGILFNNDLEESAVRAWEYIFKRPKRKRFWQ